MSGEGTTVGELVVTGQRRHWNSSDQFPERVVITPPWEYDNPHLDPDDPPPEPVDRCADPDSKREWDSDAAAADARRQFIDRSIANGMPNGFDREYGAWIYLDANGEVQLGPISEGPPVLGGGGTAHVDASPPPGVPVGQLIGYIHVHPGGGTYGQVPGGSDDGLRQWVNANSNYAADFRWYIVAPQATGAPPATGYDANKIYVYSMTTFAESGAPEVNPDGEKCPG